MKRSYQVGVGGGGRGGVDRRVKMRGVRMWGKGGKMWGEGGE